MNEATPMELSEGSQSRGSDNNVIIMDKRDSVEGGAAQQLVDE